MVGVNVKVDAFNGLIGAMAQADPQIGQYISVFSSFIQVGSGLNKISGNYKELDKIYALNEETGIEDISYSAASVKTYNKHKLESTTTTQMFSKKDGSYVAVTTTTGADGQTKQSYSVKRADGTFEVENQNIQYDQNVTDQKNLIAVEAFVEDPDNPNMQALLLCVNKNGVFGGFQGSTLPQGATRNADGTYSTTSGKIINEGTYSMYQHYHGGKKWQYSALQLGDPDYPSKIHAVNKDDISVTADGVNIHSGQASGRSSSACQNIAPKTDYFTINHQYGLTRHYVYPTSRNPDGGALNLKDMQGPWPTWVAFNNLMGIDNSTTSWDNPKTKKNERGGSFVGYYYLNRL
jgi:hypothetical protein